MNVKWIMDTVVTHVSISLDPTIASVMMGTTYTMTRQPVMVSIYIV